MLLANDTYAFCSCYVSLNVSVSIPRDVRLLRRRVLHRFFFQAFELNGAVVDGDGEAEYRNKRSSH